jgi:hypothetical protein
MHQRIEAVFELIQMLRHFLGKQLGVFRAILFTRFLYGENGEDADGNANNENACSFHEVICTLSGPKYVNALGLAPRALFQL